MQYVAIALGLLSVMLMVALFMVNDRRGKAEARASSASDTASEAQRIQREMQSEASSYKLWIGYPEADNYQGLQKTYAEDMERWGSTFEESNRSFRTILENIFEENHKLAQSESDAKAQLKAIKQQLLATEAQKNDQIGKYEADYKKALADKESLSNEFKLSREQINAEKSKIADQLADQRKKIDRMVAENSEAQKSLDDKIVKLHRVIDILKSNQAPTDPYAQPADGRIAWVDQRAGKVWINLGDADHLRPQVTFSVYSGDANDVNSAVSKGSIEVVRILSPHMSEARITGDKSTRPLMEGDKVFSQVWNRGRQIGFAITGVIDLNDDGSDDIDQLKRIIQLNNGKVDAVPSKEGGIDGQMTVDTRYLILGKPPGEGRTSSKGSSKSFQKMSAEADTLNIEVITLNDFLSLMGWQSENRAIKVGKGARPGDFRARPQGDYKVQTSSPKKQFFRQRKPQPSY